MRVLARTQIQTDANRGFKLECSHQETHHHRENHLDDDGSNCDAPTGQVEVTPDGGEMQDRHVYIGYVVYDALNRCYNAYDVRWNT
jgi:hypothetical protein